MNDNEKYLKELAETDKKNKQTQLDQERANALLDIQRTQETTMPQFTQQKQQASVQSQIGAKNFAEYWANRGQANAGITPAYEMSRQNALANQIGGITTNENTAMTGFNQQRADVGTNYTNALTNATNEINANLTTNLYNEKLRQNEAIVQADKIAYDRKITEQKMAQDQANEDRNYKLSLARLNADKAEASSTANGLVKFGAVVNVIPTGSGYKYVLADGKEKTYKAGVNPYTGTINKDLYNAQGKYDPTLAKGNGYQPLYVGKNKLSNTGEVITDPNGANRSIYKTDNKKNYIWNGADNKYVEIVNKNGNWVIK